MKSRMWKIWMKKWDMHKAQIEVDLGLKEEVPKKNQNAEKDNKELKDPNDKVQIMLDEMEQNFFGRIKEFQSRIDAQNCM